MLATSSSNREDVSHVPGANAAPGTLCQRCQRATLCQRCRRCDGFCELRERSLVRASASASRRERLNTDGYGGGAGATRVGEACRANRCRELAQPRLALLAP